MPSEDRIGLGIITILLGTFFIAVQDTLVKYASVLGHISLWQIFSVRGIIALIILAIISLFITRPAIWRHTINPWSLLRSLLFVLMFVCFYGAIPYANIAILASAFYTTPLFVTLLSAVLLKEPVDRYGWLSIMIGFIGVIVMLQPGTDDFHVAMLLPIASAVCYALGAIIVRTKCRFMHPVSMIISLNLIMIIVGTIGILLIHTLSPSIELSTQNPLILSSWAPLTSTSLLIISALALLIVLGGITVVMAYQSAPGHIIAPFDYCYLVFISIFGFILFNETLTATTLLGMSIIISAGLLSLKQSHIRPYSRRGPK